ncbi:MAG: GntR family transcriptional regulator [bacterium]|jgi:GntR family transcriptional repressor for pyruvate dehydrogenase complex|nr:GntR family transcriptional regulator [bacterium]MDD3805484.1 GntR family transcriptional regulator [bacterium]MDD4557348.1 GntR family transcriptional regulator [bacterium]
MKSIKPIKRVSLTSQVIERIKEYIRDNDLQPGDMLPPEAELSNMMQVGRRVAREALKSLETIGVIELKVGKGILISEFDYNNLTKHLFFSLSRNDENLKDLVEARLALELAAMHVLINKAGKKDIERLERATAMLADATSSEEHIKADLAFHEDLIKITGNNFLIEFSYVLKQFFILTTREIKLDLDSHKKAAASHRTIIEALKNKNRDALIRSVREHLEIYKDRICI